MRLPRLRPAAAVWYRNLQDYRRSWKRNILPNFFEPLLYLVGMGIGLGAYLDPSRFGRDYLAWIAPGLLAASAMNGASFESTYNMFVKMRFHGLYDAYLCTPAEPEDIALGELLWAVTRAFVYGLGFLAVMVLVHVFGHPLFAGGAAFFLPAALLLTGLVFASIGQVFTALIPYIDLYSYYYTLFLTPLFLFSGIFFPVERFPLGPEIAWCTPLYHAVRLCRGLSLGGFGPEAWTSLFWLAGAALLLAVWPARLLRRRLWV